MRPQPPKRIRPVEEEAVFRRNLELWLAQGMEGQIVLIRGNRVEGFFRTFDAAFELAEFKWPKSLYLIQRIVAERRADNTWFFPLAV